MFENMENLKIINGMYGISSANKQFTDRPYHALIFKISGESEYAFDSQKITLTAGQVLFIPKEENYKVALLSSGESRYALINFMATLQEVSPTLYDCNKFDEFKYMIDRLIKLSLFEGPSEKFEMLSLFYKIISILYKKDERNYYNSVQKGLLKPALDYLENNIFNPNLKVGKLHMMCGISDTYFRKIFISVYGMSPKKYIQNKRLIQAKNILDSGEYSYVYEVAAAIGFDDPLYFSKSFKNIYGYFPSKDKFQGRNLKAE